MKLLPIVFALAACSFPLAAEAAPTDIAKDAEVARGAYGSRAPGAAVVVLPCGELNAWYSPPLDTVVMCSELSALSDDTVTFVAAHEFAHALMYELGVASVDEEAGADELAAIALGDAGFRDAVVAGADFFMRFARDSTKGDPHPMNLVRARQLLCLDDGEDGDHAADANCALYLDRARSSWIRVLVTALRAHA